MRSSIPKIGKWILSKSAYYKNKSFIIGDTIETYDYIRDNNGRLKADLWFWSEVISSIPGFIKNFFYWGAIMFYNYLKVFFRNILRYKSQSFINLVGLSLGFICFTLIAFFVTFHFSFDNFHKNKENIYRLATPSIAKIPDLWGPSLKDVYPEIKEYVRLQIFGEVLVEQADKKFYQKNGFYADSSFFRVFSFNLLKGNENTALINPFSIVISEELSEKLFGNENPIGKTLVLNLEEGKQPYNVTGLIEDTPSNSHFKYSFLVSQSSNNARWLNNWRWEQFYTYFLLQGEVYEVELEKKYSEWIDSKIDDPTFQHTIDLQKLTDIHLHSNLHREIEPNQSISTIYLFSIIAVLILIIAIINYINISSTQAINRGREVGVRKSIGAERIQLTMQFITESIMFIVVVFIISLTAVYLLIPFVNELFGITLIESFWDNKLLIGAIFLIAIFTGLLNGIYPSLLLSGAMPTRVIKGNFDLSNKVYFRKSMVIFQFSISAFLIISSMFIHDQMKFITNKSLGFNNDQVISFEIRSEAMSEKISAFKNELLANSNISNVSLTANLPGGSDWGIPIRAEGFKDEDVPDIRMLVVDHDFINNYEIEIAQGRGFDKNFATDGSSYIINETAAKAFNWDNPLNKKISIPAVNRDWGEVVGVIKDFHFHSLHEKISPLMLFIPPENWFSKVSVKVKSADIANTLAFIEDKWEKFESEHPFKYTFMDEYFSSLYDADNRSMKLVTYATIIAIIISCLGLYALISYTISIKTKEIGIRKVLGAKVADIIMLISKEFIILLIIANLIAWPVSYYFVSDWLQDYAYRIDINMLIFLLGSVSGLLIAFAVIFQKVVKASLSNPVKSLRTE